MNSLLEDHHTKANTILGHQLILIADDEERLRTSMRLLLEGSNRELLESATGADALQQLTTHDIDLVLLDINMPEISGLQVMKWIAEHKYTTSVIFVSADNRIDSAILALRSGAKDFIRKPYEPEELQLKVEQALYNRRLERSHALMMDHLEHSERLHRFLVEHSPDLIYTLDQHGCFMFVNTRFESMLGYLREELLGQPYYSIVHDEDIAKAHYAFNERRKDNRVTSNLEVRLKCKNNDNRNLENHQIVAMLSALGVYNDKNGVDEAGSETFLGTYGVARDITERKVAEETILFQAFHDQLTLLPNQRLFKDRLEMAIVNSKRRGVIVGVMFIDLDRFKLVNDTYGHAEGDRLLQIAAQRLSNCVRSGDTVARKGGDEFTVLLPDLYYAEDASIIANKILEAFNLPFWVAEQKCRITASIGIAVYPRDTDNVDTLLKYADIAMYRVKSSGKNSVRFFTPDMNMCYRNQISLENELRHAIDNSELELYYQPQICCNRMAVVGLETLVRWRHPVYGLLSPGDFIEIAEETDLICSVTDWVLASACKQLREWRLSGLSNLRVAVNVSPREFEHTDMASRVIKHLEYNQLPPGSLEIEITENILLMDSARVINTMKLLHKNGIMISIDDFGTCYSSLNYLKQFPVSAIKIDRSFVRDLNELHQTSPIISAIIGIANGFGLHLVAEGIETEYQMTALQSLGCDTMQGYYFCCPVPAEQIEQILLKKVFTPAYQTDHHDHTQLKQELYVQIPPENV
jgi:diguanylate cyclase (GGDEF)-like protein/PAS domain S-box-containing protein